MGGFDRLGGFLFGFEEGSGLGELADRIGGRFGGFEFAGKDAFKERIFSQAFGAFIVLLTVVFKVALDDLGEPGREVSNVTGVAEPETVHKDPFKYLTVSLGRHFNAPVVKPLGWPQDNPSQESAPIL